jgi:hypothetical protein
MLIFCLQKQRAVKIEGFPSVFTALFIDIFIKKRGEMVKNTLFYRGAVKASQKKMNRKLKE